MDSVWLVVTKEGSQGNLIQHSFFCPEKPFFSFYTLNQRIYLEFEPMVDAGNWEKTHQLYLLSFGHGSNLDAFLQDFVETRNLEVRKFSFQSLTSLDISFLIQTPHLHTRHNKFVRYVVTSMLMHTTPCTQT